MPATAAFTLESANGPRQSGLLCNTSSIGQDRLNFSCDRHIHTGLSMLRVIFFDVIEHPVHRIHSVSHIIGTGLLELSPIPLGDAMLAPPTGGNPALVAAAPEHSAGRF